MGILILCLLLDWGNGVIISKPLKVNESSQKRTQASVAPVPCPHGRAEFLQCCRQQGLRGPRRTQTDVQERSRGYRCVSLSGLAAAPCAEPAGVPVLCRALSTGLHDSFLYGVKTRVQVFRMLVVRDVEGTFVVVSALWSHPTGPEATALGLGRIWAVSSHTWEWVSVFHLPGATLNLDSKGRGCKHAASSLVLLPLSLRIPSGCQERTVQVRWSRMKGAAAGLAWLLQATAYMLCCNFSFQPGDWAFSSRYQHLIHGDEQWFNRVVSRSDFHLLCFSWSSRFSEKPGRWCLRLLAPHRAQLQQAALNCLCARKTLGLDTFFLYTSRMPRKS